MSRSGLCLLAGLAVLLVFAGSFFQLQREEASEKECLCPSLPPPEPAREETYFLRNSTDWQPLIPTPRAKIPEQAIYRPYQAPPPLDFSKVLAGALNDSEIWRLSREHCNGNGLYVYNAPNPWCDCFWGHKGSHCSHPDFRPVRNAVMFLAYGGTEFLVEIAATLQTMERHWREHNPDFDVIIFGDSDTLASKKVDLLRNATSYPVRLFETWVDLPDNQDVWNLFKARNDAAAVPSRQPECGGSMNYLHMIRFFSVLQFQHPVFREYDYILRLDSHFYSTADLPCSLFKMAANANAVYMYLRGGIDREACAVGAREVAFEYARTEQFPPNHLHYTYSPNVTAFSGTFAMFKTSFWRHAEVLRFLHVWDRSGHIYFSRTGEQVLYRVITALFVPEWATAQICDFPQLFLHRSTRFEFLPCPAQTQRCIS